MRSGWVSAVEHLATSAAIADGGSSRDRPGSAATSSKVGISLRVVAIPACGEQQSDIVDVCFDGGDQASPRPAVGQHDQRAVGVEAQADAVFAAGADQAAGWAVFWNSASRPIHVARRRRIDVMSAADEAVLFVTSVESSDTFGFGVGLGRAEQRDEFSL